MRPLLIVFVMALGAPAFAQVAVAPEENPWTLTLRLFGGPAALDRQIVLSNTGMATATNHSPERMVSEQLSPDEVQFLTRLARSYAPNDLPSTTCTDCVRYELEIDANGRLYQLKLTNRQLAASGAEGLVTALTRVLNRMLTQRP